MAPKPDWTERLKPARLDTVHKSLREVNPRAAFATPVQFAETLAALSIEMRDMPTRASVPFDASRSTGQVHAHASNGSAHPFASATLPLPAQVERAAFQAFVRGLPDSVVRAKGLVRFADQPHAMFVWNRISGRKEVLLDASSPHADAQPSALFIGVDLPRTALADAVRALDIA